MTAKEFLNNRVKNPDLTSNFEQIMIEFTKYHVEQALKTAIENVEIEDIDEHGQYSPSVNENSILNAYPLEKIK